MNEPLPSSRKLLGRAMVAAAILVTGLMIGVEHARITRLEGAISSSDETDAVESLTSRTAELAGEVQALKDSPQGASQEAVNALQSESAARWSQLQEVAAASATAADLAVLKDRMDQVEKRLLRAHHKATNAAPAARPEGVLRTFSSETNLEPPPFLPLGIELRGGERFLSIVPAGSSSLSKARALYPGEREGSWLLLRIERDVAHFQVEGQLRRVSVPQ